jgi:hypothetical protein
MSKTSIFLIGLNIIGWVVIGYMALDQLGLIRQ